MSVVRKPDEDGKREVVLNDRVIGYIVLSNEKFKAYDTDGDMVATRTSLGECAAALSKMVRNYYGD